MTTPRWQANACIGDPLPDTDRCKVRAEPSETEHKTEHLTADLPSAPSLDGAILPGAFAEDIGPSEIASEFAALTS